MKNRNKTTLILYGLCLAIWAAKSVLEIIDKHYAEHPVQFALDVVCVILWAICFIFAFKKVRTEKDE